MCKIELKKSELETRLLTNPEQSIPRSVKLLRLCLEDWLANPKSEFSPLELMEFCKVHAGKNGENAFMRAFVAVLCTLAKEEDFLKLNNFADNNQHNPQLKELMANILHRIETADVRLINSFQKFLLQ